MADLSLSLLSRGCGRFVSSSGDSYGFDGRLEVCFTPKDYFNWRSHDSMLHLSKSGHLLSEAEFTLPKTFSTRRGPLLLYSQALITVEASHGSDTRKRWKHDVQEGKQEVEKQLSTLKELTAAILNYRTNQFICSRLGSPFFPSPHLSYDPDPQQTGSLPVFTTPEPSEPDLHGQLSSWWGSGPAPADRYTSKLGDQPEDPQTNFSAEEEEEHGSSKRVRLDLFLEIPCTSRTPTPQKEPQPWVHYTALTLEDLADPQSDTDITALPHHPLSSQVTEKNPPETREELHHLSCEADETIGPGSETSADQNNSERSINSSRRGRRVRPCVVKHESGPEPQTNPASGLLPPLTDGQSGCDGAFREKTGRQRWQGFSSDAQHAQLLPLIAESHTGSPSMKTWVQTQQDAADNLTGLHQQPLVLPQLVPDQFKKIGAEGGTTQRQSLKKGGGGGKEGGRLLFEKGFMMSLDPGAGRKGPGKQSSSAFLQNRMLSLKDPREPEDKRVIRGVLPLELRGLQSDKPVGCLIVGPDGEILKLSLYESSQDAAKSNTQGQALQVMSPEGEKLPWVIMLQPEHTLTDGELKQGTDAPVDQTQLHQSTQELTDLLGSPAASSPRCSSTDSETRTQTQSTEDRWKSEREEAQRNIRSETVGREEQEQKGGDAKEKEEMLRDAEHVRGPSGLTETGQKSRNHREEPTEEASERKSRNMRREDPDVAAKTKRERDVETGNGPEGQKTRKKERSLKEKGRQDAQPIRSQKKERTERDAAETQDRSDPSADVKRKMREREGEEERQERGDAVRRKPGSAGRMRRRRGEVTHKEIVIEDSEEQEEVKTNQDTKGQSYIKSTRSLNPEAEPADHLHTSSDKLSSVQSVSSLRSTAAESNLRSSRRSSASSCEGVGPASAVGLSSSHGRLSSCSTVMVTEEQLMLNSVKPEASRPAQSQKQEEELKALAQRAERRRQEVERKRREREEEERRRQEREQTEDRMKNELEEERRRRAEKIRSKKKEEEEKRKKQDEEEQERARREQEHREREKRRQEEKKKQMERLQRMRVEEDRRRKAEAERLQLEEERRKEEENKKLQEMDEKERTEYLQRKEQEEEEKERRKNEEERRREEETALQAAEEARLQADQLNRQMVLLQQQLAFQQGLVLEAAGLKESQRISRPWTFSYFTLLKFLSPNPDKSVTKTSSDP